MASIDKKSLSEQDIRSKFITPAILEAGWDLHSQMLEEVAITAGRVIVQGQKAKRGTPKFADYILYHKPNLPLAVVEAKDNKHTVADGMQQALGYAESLNLPFVFSSNGDAFHFHDKTIQEGKVEKEIPLDQFPGPEELWTKYKTWKGFDKEQERIVTQDYYSDGSRKTPRYYQLNAINKTIEAVAEGNNRLLLVMATGTGKTYTAFQIIWRLWKSGTKKRILFLADRNILVDQTRINDFKPFGSAMTKIAKRQIDKSYEIYLSLYQAVTGTEEEQNIYKQFSPDFFDLVVIDECHRGSAAEDSAWRQILDYFSSATHIGLTATPKETKEISNITYFGDPVYTYSLKQGIQDGFLAPYKVIRIGLDKDLQGWRPEKGKTDKYGNIIEDRVYNRKDFDRDLILDKRTEIVAKKVSEYLKGTDRYDKTIVFCENIDHAERMRQALVNENEDLARENRRYVMRITGDNNEGKAELDNFIDPESRYPVIVTTSKLMTTGVDCQTCKLIVLDRTINSIPEFKQIIGRGTRINQDYGKLFFTIMDFRNATDNFSDPLFDGDPVVIYEPGDNDPVVPPENPDPVEPGEGETGETDDPPTDHTDFPDLPPDGSGGGSGSRTKYYVDDVEVWVLSERVQYFDENGDLITESLKQYTQNKILDEYKTLSEFLKRWNEAEQKQVIIQELEERGVFLDALAEEVGKDFGPFDLICHVAYDQPPLTRRERAENVRKQNYFTQYGDDARAVLNALLDKYADEGIEHLEDLEILKVQPLSELGTAIEIIRKFGGKEEYLQAIRELENYLYECAG